MKEIIVFGNGEHAKVVIDCIECEDKYIIKAVVSEQETLMKANFHQYEWFNFSKLESIGIKIGIIAIGDNFTRKMMVNKITEIIPDFQFITTIHPSATISKSATVGNGTTIFAGAIVNPFCKIGNHCTINTASSIDHDSVMNDFSSIAPGVHTGGVVTIGKFSAISIGASIIHGISIGDNCVIGAGSTVIDNIPGNSVAVGTPCKVIKPRNPGEKYL